MSLEQEIIARIQLLMLDRSWNEKDLAEATHINVNLIKTYLKGESFLSTGFITKCEGVFSQKIIQVI